jgi:hypothetical protein
MRTVILLVLVGVICLVGGFYAGSAATERARLAGAEAALLSANRALTADRPDQALQCAFAAIDRNPDLYSAYEVAGDAIAKQHDGALSRNFYNAALKELVKNHRSPVAGSLSEPQVATERSRIEGKLKALASGS